MHAFIVKCETPHMPTVTVQARDKFDALEMAYKAWTRDAEIARVIADVEEVDGG